MLTEEADYAGWADKIEGENFNADDGVFKLVRHEPLGVCAGIGSWNSPILYIAWKIAPALAAGNTVAPLTHSLPEDYANSTSSSTKHQKEHHSAPSSSDD